MQLQFVQGEQYSVMVKLGRMEREFKPPNSVAIAGRIGELAVSVMRSIKFPPLS